MGFDERQHHFPRRSSSAWAKRGRLAQNSVWDRQQEWYDGKSAGAFGKYLISNGSKRTDW